MAEKAAAPTVWITYAWTDDTEGDFSYLVQELATVNVRATFDRIALVPGRDLWAQIGDNITLGPSDGWAYLLTPASLASEPCREELAYAVNRALGTKGRNFPLIGLLHGVRIQDVPPALRVRLGVSLANPNWKQEVRAGLFNQAPAVPSVPQTKFVWTVHEGYGGVSSHVAIEVRPRFGEVMYWRFAIPAGTKLVRFGHGPAGGAAISGMQTMTLEGGTGQLEGHAVQFFGAGDKLSPGTSAYAVLERPVPSFVYFGQATEPFGPPANGEKRSFRS
jgi:hypothetical protein